MSIEDKVNLLPKILEDLDKCINENVKYECSVEEATIIFEYIMTLNTMVDTREQKIKSALEIIDCRLKENDNHVNARMEMFHYKNLKTVLTEKEDVKNVDSTN